MIARFLARRRKKLWWTRNSFRLRGGSVEPTAAERDSVRERILSARARLSGPASNNPLADDGGGPTPDARRRGPTRAGPEASARRH